MPPVVPVMKSDGKQRSMNEPEGIGGNCTSRKAILWLGIIMLAFLAVRLPVIYHQPGGQDEDCYAVPGLTIVRTGYPQLPHVPARNLESVYYRADEMLYSEPPLYFYYQAAYYALLPDVYGTARLASVFCGLVMIGLGYRLARAVGLSQPGALAAMGALSVSRWFYFPATCARPDILCALFGIVAIQAFLQWKATGHVRWMVAAGVYLGLGGLTHPFAVVYAVQLAVWAGITSRGWKRIGAPALLAGVSLIVFSLWIPLILKYPETFRIQFRNQFMVDSGGSIIHRLMLPFPSLSYHANAMWQHIGGLQICLLGLGLVACTILSWRGRQPGLWAICALAWSSIYLMSVAVGTHHMVGGYWVYPAALAIIPMGYVVQRVLELSQQKVRQIALIVLLIGVFLPGSGIRATWAYLKNWNDTRYDAPRFAKQIIDSLPADGVYVVDKEFTLDFVAAGRTTLLATTMPQYFRADQFKYDHLIVGRFEEPYQLARQLEGQWERTEGIAEDIFACLARIYRSPPNRIKSHTPLP